MFSANSSQVSEDRLYVEDVFSTYLYTGNGSTQTITNGIDLTGKGGLVWIKQRNGASYTHNLADTVRGNTKYLYTSATDAEETVTTRITSFGSSGYNLGANLSVNGSGNTYASWTFRKAPKFFDVVTYTGNGVNGRAISHSLGATPGCIIVKATNTSGLSWFVYHRSAGVNGSYPNYLYLNSTSAAQPGEVFGWNAVPTATEFFIGQFGEVNNNGTTYVAYLFAHDTTSDGIIQCGSYTGNGSATGPTVTLGWEPQWIMIKRSNSTGSWVMLDNMRGMAVGGNDARLLADASDAETTSGNDLSPTATGFQLTTTSPETNANGSTYIYIAIRRGPMRTPTSGTSVYKSVTRNGTGSVPWVASGAGFPPDMTIMSGRNLVGFSGPGSYQNSIIDRLRRATEHIQTINTNGEGGGWGSGHIHNMDGYNGLYSGDMSYYNASSGTYVDHHFRRAPSFFDVVCYTGNFTANRNISHNLGVTPELIIMKSRSAAYDWNVYHTFTGSGHSYAFLNSTAAGGTATYAVYGENAPTSTTFSVGADNGTNASGGTYVAYLFASCPGVSKVGSYTGNGSSQTINSGFTNGARFVLIKGVSGYGVDSWYVWDSARGIVAGNDPYLMLNNAQAEIASNDSIDPTSSGFVVNQIGDTNINYTGTTYIYLAVA